MVNIDRFEGLSVVPKKYHDCTYKQAHVQKPLLIMCCISLNGEKMHPLPIQKQLCVRINSQGGFFLVYSTIKTSLQIHLSFSFTGCFIIGLLCNFTDFPPLSTSEN